MHDEERINPGHTSVRQTARAVGPILAIVGGIFMAVGLISFFSAFNGGGMPQYFWCCFVGMPLLALGIAITKFAYLGAFFRYVAGEAAPVQRDTFNYLAEGMRPGVKGLAQAVSEGLSAGTNPAPEAASKYCTACGQPISPQANFCSACGQKV